MKSLPAITAEIIGQFENYQETNWQDMKGDDLVSVDPCKWLTAALLKVAEETVEAVMPEKEHLPQAPCINAEMELFGGCFVCEKTKGYNDAVAKIDANFKTFINQ